MKRFLCAVFLVLVWLAPQAHATQLVGINTTGSQAAYGSYSPNNGVISSAFVASASGTATSCFVRISVAAGANYRCAIYDSAGTTKLADSVQASDGTTGWVQLALNSSTSIVLGTTYRLAVFNNGSYLWLEADGSGFHDLETQGQTYPTWPSALGALGVGEGYISIYIDGTTGGGSSIVPLAMHHYQQMSWLNSRGWHALAANDEHFAVPLRVSR